jgi:hypothetical protein
MPPINMSEKLLELQEAMQHLQMLKQIGAEKLIMSQEKEIFNIQQDLMTMDNDASLDAVDAILPKKMSFLYG